MPAWVRDSLSSEEVVNPVSETLESTLRKFFSHSSHWQRRSVSAMGEVRELARTSTRGAMGAEA